MVGVGSMKVAGLFMIIPVACSVTYFNNASDFFNINDHEVSVNYLYPQRYMQRVVCLCLAIQRNLDELFHQTGYLQPLVQQICSQVSQLKNAVIDLAENDEQADVYLHEDILFILDRVRDIDKKFLMLTHICYVQQKVLHLLFIRSELFASYQKIAELLNYNKECLATCDDSDSPVNI